MESTESVQDTQSGQIQAVQEYCQRYLSKERYEHLVRVWETMREVKQRHGLSVSEEKLALAGFGHDIARELPGEVSALLLQQSGVELEPWEREFKLFCHTKAGILILRECFGVDDEEVFQAVAHHTLGNSGLCQLARLLYIADFLEPKRPFLTDEERENYMAMEFDRTVYEVCRRTAEFLRDSSKPILPPTLAMIRELEQHLGIGPGQCFVLPS
ncbi:bis(5'-nucleosyl)-tetraphosphatase (symmetrical) YqeK [Candidatus Haliotispira prima]|uniref:bis(5'-nucleosyl)-tetraphosphatase (symmetrical) n=1 Tax=Candidatus Haliotispira prima TaxID=3034016 RepID=A0ABY8MHM6_9SPIO|nr:bis(5'-nucleosyl)-tetraphosphatase (symmetrical) YqeK [Candidatus Haliotispira prima]